MDDRGRKVEPYLKLVNSDGSGLDAYLYPKSISGIVIDSPTEPIITLYTTGMMTPKKGVADPRLREVSVTIRGSEARAALDWYERNTGVVVDAEWSRRETFNPTIHDTFTDTDGTLIQNHTPDVGGSWTRDAITGNTTNNNALVINGNVLTWTVPAQLAHIDSGLSNGFRLSCIYRPGTSSRVGVIARYENDASFIVFRLRKPESKVELIKWPDSTALAEADYTLDSDIYHLSMTVDSSNVFRCFINSVQVLTATVTDLGTITAQGLTSFGGNDFDYSFDDFIVEPI